MSTDCGPSGAGCAPPATSAKRGRAGAAKSKKSKSKQGPAKGIPSDPTTYAERLASGPPGSVSVGRRSPSSLAALFRHEERVRARASVDRVGGLVVPRGGAARTVDDLAEAPRRSSKRIKGLDRTPGQKPERPPTPPSHLSLMDYIRADETLMALTVRPGPLWGAANLTAPQLLARLNEVLASLERAPYDPAPPRRRRFWARGI